MKSTIFGHNSAHAFLGELVGHGNTKHTPHTPHKHRTQAQT